LLVNDPIVKYGVKGNAKDVFLQRKVLAVKTAGMAFICLNYANGGIQDHPGLGVGLAVATSVIATIFDATRTRSHTPQHSLG
jgi:hypothetical protein